MGPRHFVIASMLSALVAAPSLAQSQQPRRSEPLPPPQRSQPLPPPQQRPGQPPQQAASAPKPYKPVAVSAPSPVSDPSFEPFRKQLAAIAEKKDRKALAALVASNFFWMAEGKDKAVKGRPGIENLAKALSLDDADGGGWDALEGYAADTTASPFDERQNTICAPAEPQFNTQEFDQLTEATGTDDSDWAVPTRAGLDMRANPQPNAAVVEKLGMHFIRVLDDDSAPPSQDNPMIRVVAPSGKTGYVPVDAVSPLANDQLCYVKQGGAWKIAGFLGGEQ